MKVEQVMCRNTKTCRSSDSLDRAAQLMWENDCGCVPIVDDEGRGVGMITDRDVCMAAYTQGGSLAHLCVGTAMAHDLRSCRATDTIAQAENIMRAAQVRRLPVVDPEGHVIGLLSLNDVVREAARERATSSKPEIPADDVAATLGAICALRGERQVAAAA
jgi:CBS domain-containing protein